MAYSGGFLPISHNFAINVSNLKKKWTKVTKSFVHLTIYKWKWNLRIEYIKSSWGVRLCISFTKSNFVTVALKVHTYLIKLIYKKHRSTVKWFRRTPTMFIFVIFVFLPREFFYFPQKHNIVILFTSIFPLMFQPTNLSIAFLRASLFFK